ncbi:MAG: M24 family metallopeptidase [Roseiflexaceae bacterium]
MPTPNYWFERAEYTARLARVQAEIQRRGLDALIAFQPESVTWVTGFYSRAYSSFQFAIIPASGAPTLFCRDVESYYLETTCIYPDHAVWNDSEDVTARAAAVIRQRLGASANVGAELGTWTLSVARFERLKELLPGVSWHNHNTLVASMRLIKSPAEIAYQRRASVAAAAGMQAAIDSAQVGASERDMAAAICDAMIRAGSDLPGPGVMASGERAYHLHGYYTDRVLALGDIVQIETTPNVRHYHARFMRPIKVAHASDADYRTVEQLVAIQDAALATIKPGVAATVPDRIYREGVLSAGLRDSYTNKTMYSVGFMLLPVSGEDLEASPVAEWSFAVGMTLHTYVLAQGFGMSETIAITPDGYERLTTFPRQLFVS